MTPGFSWATTSSNSNPVTGLNVGLQAGWGVGGQIGYSFGNGGGRFDEEGVVSPGASATVFWVWKLPWKWQINIPKIHF
jgi:hypothetical protein